MAGLIYEVNLSVDKAIIESFDEWLAGHVEEMLRQPGFLGAEVFDVEDDVDGRARRVSHYHVETRTDLENYLENSAARMRQDAVDRFGDRFSATRRVLQEVEAPGGDASAHEHCLNCGRELAGQYCANCGQRSRSRLISLWELLRDAFGDIFELDSRLWRTLVPLLTKPGRLTRDYLEGKRARFMPPFRTYIVLSLLFLFIALFDPRQQFSILFEPEPEAAPGEQEPVDDEAKRSADEIRLDVLEQLQSEGVIGQNEELQRALEEARARSAGEERESETRPPQADGPAKDGESDSARPSFQLSIDGKNAKGGGCNFQDEDLNDLPQWIAKRLTPERLHAVCNKIEADEGQSLWAKMQDSIPAALFVLLPLMAFVLMMLYPLSKRYYVEHLLFVVHFHAFFFLMLTLMLLFAGGAGLASLPQAVTPIVMVAASFYFPVYLYKSMRRVYQQGHLATVPKFVLLVVAYFLGLALITAVTFIVTAFSL